jgi:hypothetical protein
LFFVLFRRTFLHIYIPDEGEGALCADDLQVLQDGCLIILPNTKIGQRVVLYDPSKDYHSTLSHLTRFERHRRCFFHCISLLTDSESSASSTIAKSNNHVSLVMLIFMNQSLLHSIDDSDQNRNDTFLDILNLFPNIRIVRIHVFLEPVGMGWYSYQENAKRKAIQLFDTTSTKNTRTIKPASDNSDMIDDDDDNNNNNNNNNDMCIHDLIEFHTLSNDNDDIMIVSSDDSHDGKNAEQLGEALSVMFQFEKESLPVSLGGTWTYSCFQAWQEKLMPSSATKL